MTTYPETPGYAKGSQTSEEAAEKLTTKDAIRNGILDLMIYPVMTVCVSPSSKPQFCCGSEGLTADEALILLQHNLNRKFDRSTIAARFTELKHEGLIVETAATRPSARGRNSAVHMLSSAYGHSVAPSSSRSRSNRGNPHHDTINTIAVAFIRHIQNNKDLYGNCRIDMDGDETRTILKMAEDCGLL